MRAGGAEGVRGTEFCPSAPSEQGEQAVCHPEGDAFESKSGQYYNMKGKECDMRISWQI